MLMPSEGMFILGYQDETATRMVTAARKPVITIWGRLLSIEPDSRSAKAAKTQSLKWVWVPAKGEALSAPPRTPVSGLLRHLECSTLSSSLPCILHVQ